MSCYAGKHVAAVTSVPFVIPTQLLVRGVHQPTLERFAQALTKALTFQD